MRWSNYNLLFTSSNGTGFFCYNALSNALIELDEPHYQLLAAYRNGQPPTNSAVNEFLSFLNKMCFIVQPDQEETLLLIRQYRRQAACFQGTTFGLTICPTLSCNFRCPYCFETSQYDGGFMTKETEGRLVAWIKEQPNITDLSVGWYGGEPLLAFESICRLTEQFLSLDLGYENADLITNGYLLDTEKISRLNDLKIRSVQITLDGPPEVHDTRRFLADGSPTFARIMDSIAGLMDSDYAGSCSIRVNLDRNNRDGFLDLRAELLARFAGKKLTVYPGKVYATEDRRHDADCYLNTHEWSDFNRYLAARINIAAALELYPTASDSICTANMFKSFTVGPEGELYKCYEVVGQPSMIVGTIHDKTVITNPVLPAQYVIGVDPYRDPECLSCTVLPICGGGCHNHRVLAKYFGRNDIDYCSPYKTRLRDCLEAYIDAVRSREFCSALLKTGKSSAPKNGYRIISPAALHAGSHVRAEAA